MTFEAAGGTQVGSTGGGEFDLATLTAAGVYSLATDLSNMAAGDQITIRAKVKTRSASASKQHYFTVFTDVQSSVVPIGVPVPVPHEVVFTLEQNSGASTINVEWAAYRS